MPGASGGTPVAMRVQRASRDAERFGAPSALVNHATEDPMALITHGTVTVDIPDNDPLPPKAGKLSKEDIQNLPPPPRITGRVCIQAADAIDRAGTAFSPPPGVTIASLRAAGESVENIDKRILDMEVMRRKLLQANRIIGTEAWKQVRQVNDAMKAQMKHDPGLALIFQRVLDAFAVFASDPTNDNDVEEPVEEVVVDETDGDGDVVPPTPA